MKSPPATSATGQRPAPEAVVLVIPHQYAAEFCQAPTPKAKAADDCIVTRAMFEAMLDALPKPDKSKAADLPPELVKGFANAYATTVGWAHAAHLRGLDKSTRFKLQRQWVDGQILQRALKESLLDPSQQPSEAAIAAYYKDNQRRFEQIKLQRLYVPAQGDADPAQPTAERAKATIEDAQKFRARAIAGEPLPKLQDEIWKTLKKAGTPPPLNVTRRRGAMRPENEAAVFDLAPNGFSDVVQEGAGFTCYQLIEKKVIPLDEAREEISRTLSEQAAKDVEAEITQKIKPEFNPSYFGEAKPASSRPALAIPAKPAANEQAAPPPAATQPAGASPATAPKANDQPAK